MKTLKYLFIFIVCISFANCNNNMAEEKAENSEIVEESDFAYKDLISAQLACMNMPRPADSYSYPVYPGMEEWAQFKTVEEMTDACQVPEEVLRTMSTQAIIQAIWEYPFLLEILHRDQYQMDFESLFLQNNAYKELSGRTDAGKSLLERLVVADHLNWDARYHPKALEILFAQTVFLSQLNDNEKKTAIQTTFEKDNVRQLSSEWTDISFRETTWFLIGKTMANANYLPFMDEVNNNEKLKSFIEDKNNVYMAEILGDILPLIIIHAKNYISEN
jgi:hypothetical protein